MSHEARAAGLDGGETGGEPLSAIPAERRVQLLFSLLKILDRPSDLAGILHDLLEEVVAALDLTGAAIRVTEGDDSTYHEAVGLAPEFVARERSLKSSRSAAGCLDCMCGRVLDGHTTAKRPYFTGRGSFWTGNLGGLLARASEEERSAFSRATCLRQGFASMALVPLSSGQETVGLLQLVDRRSGRFDAPSVAFVEDLAMAVGIAVRRRREGERARHDAEAVLETNERLALLVEGSPRFFFYVQDLDGAISYVSPSVEAVTGRPVSEWTGQRHWFTTANPVNDRARERTRRHLTGTIDSSPVVCETEHADGRPILLEVFEFGRFREGELAGIHGIAHDITEEHRSTLERDRLFELSLDMLCIADFDGQLRQVNPAWERTLGWTTAELTSGPYFELVHPDDLEATRAVAGRLAEGHPVVGFVNRYRHRDGSYRWISWNTAPIFEERLIFGVARDVTDERERERALAASERKYRTLVESMNEIVFVLDREQRHVEVSGGLVAKEGLRIEELLGRTASEVLGPQSAAPHEAANRRALAGESVVYEWRLPHGDGERIFETSLAPLPDPDGRVGGIVGVGRDVTEVRRAAAAEAQRARQLAAVNRIARRTASLTDLDDLFQTTVAEIHDALGYHSVGILSVDRERHQLCSGKMAGAYARRAHPDYRQSLDRGLLGEAARSGRTVLSNDVSSDPRYELGFDEDPGTRAEVGVPVMVEGEVVAVIDVHEDRTGAFTESDVTTLETVADQLAIAIRNSRLYEQARGSEERYRQLFMAHPVPMWVYELETLRFLEVNDAAVHRYGYSRDEFLAMTLADIRPPEDLPALQVNVEKSRRAGGYERSGAWRHRTRSGELISVNIDSNELIYGGRAARVVSAYDVTDRLAAESALRESEARHRHLIENAAEIIYRTDATGRLVYCNPAAFRLFGSTPAGLIGRSFMEFVRADARAETARLLDRRRPEWAEGVYLEAPLVANDGAVVWIGASVQAIRDGGDVVGYQSVARDITARRAAEEALRESEARYREFFEDDLTGDYITTADGQLVACNRAFLKIFGFASEQEAMAADMSSLYASAEARRQFVERLEREGSLLQHELELRRRDGSPVQVVENVRGIRDADGRMVQLKGYMFDITAHKRTEEQLRHAQKMEAMGRLAGGVAHDFNNLLQAMLSTLQYLRLSGAGPEALPAATQELEEHVKRGAGLARQLLLFSRRGVTKPEKLDLNDVVVEAVRLLVRVVPANIRLEVAAAEGPLVVDGDRGQLEQVLTNLVLNAADAMPDGGLLEVRTWASNGDVGVSVADTGMGMDEATRARIFEPFFTTKGERGTGLGLSVVHGIVTHHGGAVSVETAMGRGTTVHVKLPRHASGVFSAVRDVVAAAAPAAGAAERILVVEDNHQIRGLFARMLERLGYRVTAVGSAEAALELTSGAGFALLLTDVMLPGISGVELSRRLREQWPSIKVILVSGYAEDEVFRSDVAAGHLRFLQKPVDLATLAGEVRASLSRGDA